MRYAALALSLAVLPVCAGQPLVYSDGATRLAGYLSKPAAAKGKVPGVVVIHQWMGLTEHERQVSDDLAKLGYVALAADIYGEGVRPKNTGEAGKLAGSFKGDRPLYRRRIAAAIETLKAQKGVDGSRLAVHAFTQKEAGHDNSKGAAYNEAAHHRSWQHMKDFFQEIF